MECRNLLIDQVIVMQEKHFRGTRHLLSQDHLSRHRSLKSHAIYRSVARDETSHEILRVAGFCHDQSIVVRVQKHFPRHQ